MIVYREISSLCQDLGYSARTLYALSNSIERHYHTVELKKPNGGTRVLHIPDKFLKSVQKRISEVLLQREPISSYAVAYRVGGSTRVNACKHVGKNKILKLDIRKFFDYITYPMIKERVFAENKYSEPIRILLSVLCVYTHRIPQGAPTSPAISNIILRDFDEIVGAWCEQREISYSRYCDDMTFSGDFNEKEVIRFVELELRRNGFFLNHKKTVCLHNGQRKQVTGVVVNEKLSVPADYKKRIRQEVYFIEKFGIDSHLTRMDGAWKKEAYINNLLGRINYVLSVEQKNAEMFQLRKQIQELRG